MVSCPAEARLRQCGGRRVGAARWCGCTPRCGTRWSASSPSWAAPCGWVTRDGHGPRRRAGAARAASTGGRRLHPIRPLDSRTAGPAPLPHPRRRTLTRAWCTSSTASAARTRQQRRCATCHRTTWRPSSTPQVGCCGRCVCVCGLVKWSGPPASRCWCAACCASATCRARRPSTPGGPSLPPAAFINHAIKHFSPGGGAAPSGGGPKIVAGGRLASVPISTKVRPRLCDAGATAQAACVRRRPRAWWCVRA